MRNKQFKERQVQGLKASLTKYDSQILVSETCKGNLPLEIKYLDLMNTINSNAFII